MCRRAERSGQVEGTCRTRPESPLRILLLVSAFRRIGGVQETVDHLADQFISKGHRVAIVTDHHLLDSTPERASLAETELTILHIPTESPPTWRHLERLIKRSREIVAAEEGIANYIRAWQPDVVNCHEWHWDRFPVIARACRHVGVPLIFTLYDTCGRGNLGNKPLDYLRSASALITISLSSKSAIERLLNRSREIQIIYPGVDVVAATAAAPHPWPRPYIFSTGRLQLTHKAFDLLISSFAAIAGSYPSIDLLIAGNGPDRPLLERLIERKGLAGRVSLLGTLSRQELWSFYKGCLFFAMPSRMHEGLGMVFLEAMASAKAVIGTAIGGVSEVVSDGQTGVLLGENDPDALAAAFRRFIDDPQQLERMGRRGYHSAVGWHNWPDAAAEYLAVYETVLSRAAQADSGRIRALG